MTAEVVAELLFVGFVVGCLICGPLCYRRGKLAAARHLDIDTDDDEWWQL